MASVFPSTWNSRIVPGGISSFRAARRKAISKTSGELFQKASVAQLTASSCRLTWRRRLRHHHVALELFHHLGVQAHLGGPLRERHLVDLVLQLKQRVKQAFR